MAKGDSNQQGSATNRINPGGAGLGAGMRQGPGANYVAPGPGGTMSSSMGPSGGAIGAAQSNAGPSVGPSNSSGLIAQILAQKYGGGMSQGTPFPSPAMSPVPQTIDAGTGMNRFSQLGFNDPAPPRGTNPIYNPGGPPLNPNGIGYAPQIPQPGGNMQYLGGSKNFNESGGKGYTGNDMGMFGPGGPMNGIGPSNQDALIKMIMMMKQQPQNGGMQYMQDNNGYNRLVQ